MAGVRDWTSRLKRRVSRYGRGSNAPTVPPTRPLPRTARAHFGRTDRFALGLGIHHIGQARPPRIAHQEHRMLSAFRALVALSFLAATSLAAQVTVIKAGRLVDT